MKKYLWLFFWLIGSLLFSQTPLEVSGDIKIGNSQISNPEKGSIRYNEATNDFEGWNGAHWMSLTAGKQEGTVRDINGYEYRTIMIGDQEWMAENLRTYRYRNGNLITLTQGSSNWHDADYSAYCWYNNDSSNDVPFGKLYNWAAVRDPRGLCPSGWHVPTTSDWQILTTTLGNVDIAGGKMKEVTYWNSPNYGGTNSSGFSGLPGGIRAPDGDFSLLGQHGYWWSGTRSGTSATYAVLRYHSPALSVTSGNLQFGFSVRCIKD